MKFTPFIAAAILAYGAAADEAQKPLTGDEGAAEAASSSVDASLPTFTVSQIHSPQHRTRTTISAVTQSRKVRLPAFSQQSTERSSSGRLTGIVAFSPPLSRLRSSSNSPTTGRLAGSPRTPRRTARTMKSGPTLASGPLRSQLSTREWRATRAWLSRTRLLTTPSRPSSPRRSTPRASPSLSSTRSSFRVSFSGLLLLVFLAKARGQTNPCFLSAQTVSSAVVLT